MKTIFKYQLALTGEPQDVLMSEGAVILKAMVQRGDLFLWAMVDQDGEPEDRTIRMFATGETIDDQPRVYIDTVMLRKDSLVLHIFEEIHGPACHAVQHSDQMVCEQCQQRWDVNDPLPPVCVPPSNLKATSP